MIDEVRIDTDEDGFALDLTGDLVAELRRYLDNPDAHTVRLRLSQDAAIQLHGQVKQTVDPWVAEFEFYRDEHRALGDLADGYDLTDPKHPDYAETMATAGDTARKRTREA
jgi:hypothetical protein